MTAKEKTIVEELVKYARAVGLNGHSGIKELLKEAIENTEKILKK